MKLKRLIAAVATVALAAGTAAFAQSAEYDALLKKAKDYEAKKQYVHALGTYWDAMEAEPTEKAAEALEAFNKLGAVIKDGNPGWGEFDEFDIYDGWLALCTEYEQYWTKVCPCVFTFTPLKKGALDMATRTATYSTLIKVDETQKYKRIADFVLTGLKKKRNRDWKAIDTYWPQTSVYASEDKTFNKNGVALVKLALRHGSAMVNYMSPNVPAALLSVVTDDDDRRFNHDYFWQEGRYTYGTDENGRSTEFKRSMYDVKFTITNEAGTVLLTSGRKLMGSNGAVEFKGVPQATMKVIDSGKYRIVPIGLWLEYGKLQQEYSPGSRDWIKPLPELTLDVKSAKFNLPNEESRDADMLTTIRISKYLNGDGLVTVEGGTFTMGSGRDAHDVTVSTFLMMAVEVPQALYQKVMGTNPSPYTGAALPVGQVSWYDAVEFCNRLSELRGFSPCYSLNGSTDVSTWGSKGKEWDSVACDFTANGYRLPTEAEWEYAARGGPHHSAFKYSGSDKLDEVAWYQSNSEVSGEKRAHDVGTKAPNALGIYDMSGNVKEWCWDWFGYDYGGYSKDAAVVDPTGAPSGKEEGRVIRGDYYYTDYYGKSLTDRDYYSPERKYAAYGFRIVRSAQ